MYVVYMSISLDCASCWIVYGHHYMKANVLLHSAGWKNISVLSLVPVAK